MTTVELGEATALAYPDDSFDLVVALFAWHHVGDWHKATAEAARVLRPDGTLILVDLLNSFFVWPIGALFPAGRYLSLR